MNPSAPVYFQTSMPRFAANLSMMFTDVPFPQRFEAAARAGFNAVDYEYLFSLMDELNYTGWVGCEYRPAGRTEDGLGWLHAQRQGRHSE